MGRKCEFFFHFLTLFPETIPVWLEASIIGRAKKRGLFDYKIWNLRDFARDVHRTVDDRVYGGGGGLLLKIEPLVLACEQIQKEIAPSSLKIITFSPAGKKWTQVEIEKIFQTLPKEEAMHFLLVAGHYEGIDQRFLDHWAHHIFSIGDFVVSGGELPALLLVDSLIRQIPGCLNQSVQVLTESFSLLDKDSGERLMEYPQYTRPRLFRGLSVPEVLLSGNHREIEKWRFSQSLGLSKIHRIRGSSQEEGSYAEKDR